MCPAIPSSLQDEKFFMLGLVPLHGFHSAHVSRNSERYRSLPSPSSTEILSHGYSKQTFAQYFNLRKPTERLTNLCRLCPDPHWPRSASLCQRFLWSGFESNRLCSGPHSHRFMSVAFSLGQVPKVQRGRKITHSLGPAREHSFY